MTPRALSGFVLAALLLAGPSVRDSAAAGEPIRLGGDERILVLAPHPDDETLAAGGLIQEALGLDAAVRVCFFTMGDNNEIAFLFTRKHPAMMPGTVRSMGTLRQNEGLAAATGLGLSTNDLVFLGYPDSGTLDIWNHHWRATPPFRSMLTRANSVPYERALTPGSAYAGEDILDDLAEVIQEFRPTHIVIPHPADHNVDHRALYLFARVALWNRASEDIVPEILAAPVHFTQWPEPRRFHPLRSAAPPHFLDEEIDWRELVLAPFQVSNKLAAIRRHHSQYLHSSAYLDSFVRKSELFGDFSDLSLPGGSGSVELAEDDASQFRPDEELFEELARQSDSWNAIAEQNTAETAILDGHDNDFSGRSISGDGTGLTLSFRFSNPISGSVALAVSLFGYRADIPFGEMPKITVELTPQGIVSAQDLDSKLPEGSVEFIPDGDKEITVRVPLSLLGNPEKILTGAMLWKGSIPVDWAAWRTLDLSGAEALVPPAAAGAEQPPPKPQEAQALTPRVTLPRKSLPAHTEANEPVFW